MMLGARSQVRDEYGLKPPGSEHHNVVMPEPFDEDVNSENMGYVVGRVQAWLDKAAVIQDAVTHLMPFVQKWHRQLSADVADDVLRCIREHERIAANAIHLHTESYRRFERHREAALAEAQRDTGTCGICLGPMVRAVRSCIPHNTESYRSQGCRHEYCGECLSQHLITAVTDGKRIIRCPDPQCRAEINMGDVSRIGDSVGLPELASQLLVNRKVAYDARVLSEEPEIQAEIEKGTVNRCPACSVVTYRTQGCNSISCPCGASWNFESGMHQGQAYVTTEAEVPSIRPGGRYTGRWEDPPPPLPTQVSHQPRSIAELLAKVDMVSRPQSWSPFVLTEDGMREWVETVIHSRGLTTLDSCRSVCILLPLHHQHSHRSWAMTAVQLAHNVTSWTVRVGDDQCYFAQRGSVAAGELLRKPGGKWVTRPQPFEPDAYHGLLDVQNRTIKPVRRDPMPIELSE